MAPNDGISESGDSSADVTALAEVTALGGDQGGSHIDQGGAGGSPGLDAGPDSADVTADEDDDGIDDHSDNCPAMADHDQDDRDADGLGDVCDPCPDLTDASGAPEACAPECEAGLIESRPCPVRDREERTCVDGRFGEWIGSDANACEDGAMQERACEGAPSIVQTRVCVDGVLTDWTVCLPDCVPGDLEQRA